MTRSNTSDTAVLGYLGSTGRSTGPHLHLGAEVKRPGDKEFSWIDPGTIKSQLTNFGTVGTDGKFVPLTVETAPGQYGWNSAFGLTSGFRTAKRPNHQGVDVVGMAFPTQGLPWHVKRAPNIVGFGPGIHDPGGYGKNAYVETVGTDGSRYRFIKAHLDQDPNTWTNPNFGQPVDTASSSPSTTPETPATPTTQKAGGNTTVNFSISLGKKKEEEEENFLSQYINKMFLSAMMPTDYTKMASSVPNYYSDLG